VLVKDIWPGFSSSQPQGLVALGSKVLFSAGQRLINGRFPEFELWVSDGTAKGTFEVINLNGTSSGGPGSMTIYKNAAYFLAAHNGLGLWKTDGTAKGTVMVAPTTANSMVEAGGTLWLPLFQGGTGTQLWKSDGNAPKLVRTLSKAFDYPGNFIKATLNVLFTAKHDTAGDELWATNGTAAGTTVIDIDPGSGITLDSNPLRLTDVMGRTFFVADDGKIGRELYLTDGTAAGTRLVKDINPGSGSSDPKQLTMFGDTLFFTAADGTRGAELWKSDGTANGTVLVKDIQPGSLGSFVGEMTEFRGRLYFRAADPQLGIELHVTDGTTSGTVVVKEIQPGPGGASPEQLTVIGDTMFFRAFSGQSGQELWKTDGTASGTVLVKDIRPGTQSSSPFALAKAGNTLFFGAFDDKNGGELWKSDGTASGTVLVKDIVPGSGTSSPADLTDFGGQLIFRAWTAATGQELWTSDGTANGTVLLQDIYSGTHGGNPREFTVFRNQMYFAAQTNNGFALMKTDGTSKGTLPVKVVPGVYAQGIKDFVRVGSRFLVFFAYEVSYGHELWVSDGTTNGSARLTDLAPGPLSTDPTHMAVSNGRLLFSGTDGIKGREVWSVDTGATAQEIGLGCAAKGLRPRLSATDPVLGQTFSITGRDAPTNTTAALVISLPPKNALALASGCFAYVDLVQPLLVQFWQPKPTWSMQFPVVPNDANLTGATVALQVFHLGPLFPVELHGTNGIWATLGR
jgi:ELWxxDGT repeat protein